MPNKTEAPRYPESLLGAADALRLTIRTLLAAVKRAALPDREDVIESGAAVYEAIQVYLDACDAEALMIVINTSLNEMVDDLLADLGDGACDGCPDLDCPDRA